MDAVIRLTLLIQVATAVSVCAAASPIASTTVGDILGVRGETEFGGHVFKVDKFLGIPYAEAPVGQLRFEKPVPKVAFVKPFEAFSFGAACMQGDFPGFPQMRPLSEDCLFLNVYVPVEVSNKPISGFPVMIFIHGGGFTMGSGSMYHADTLSTFGEVIVVTINYRMSIFGFFTTGFEGLLGNQGLWDQHLAIKWVHNNIQAFGGDNQKVTLFGESAGSVSTAIHSVFPDNEGLFQRAITESGSISGVGLDAPNDISLSRFIAEEFGCRLPEDASPDLIIDCLRVMTADDILSKLTDLVKDPTKMMRLRFIPSFDNDFFKMRLSPFLDLKDSSDMTNEEKMFASIDLMSGVNIKEGGVFVNPLLGIESVEDFVVEREAMENMYIPLILGISHPGTEATPLKDVVSAQYTDWSRPDDPVALRDMYVDMAGDVVFVAPGVSFSKKHVNLTSHGKSFFYHFCTEPSRHLLATGTWLKGATHGDEVGYVFGFPKETIDLLIPDGSFQPEEWEVEHSKGMMTMWSNFAKTGDPNEPLDIKQYFNTNWPEFDLTSEKYLEIDRVMSADTSVKSRLRPEYVNFWTKLVPKLAKAFLHQPETPADKYKPEQTCSSEVDQSCSP